MWRQVLAIFVCAAMHTPLCAAPAVSSPNSFTQSPTVSPNKFPSTLQLQAKPTIQSVEPTGCVKTGDVITVKGSFFGEATQRALALGGNGAHVDLKPSQWTNTSITFSLPNDTRLFPGKSYYVGIEQSDHRQWLSNINVSVTLCEAAPTVKQPPTIAPTATPVVTPVRVSNAPQSTSPPQLLSLKANSCVKAGDGFSVTGKNLLANPQAQWLIESSPFTFIKPIKWGDTQADFKLPTSANLKPSGQYAVGLYDTEKQQWLGGKVKALVMCGKPSTNIPSATPSFQKNQQTVQPTVEEDSGYDETNAYEEDSYGYDDSWGYSDDYWQSESSGQSLPPQSFGSFIGQGLPSPPTALAENRERLQKKPNKPDSYEDQEVVFVSANMDEAKQLQSTLSGEGFRLRRRSRLNNLGMVFSVFYAPAGVSPVDAVSNLRQRSPDTWLDVNHRYDLMAGANNYATKLIAWDSGRTFSCATSVRIGVIDTQVDKKHPALAQADISEKLFVTRGLDVADPAHGTAVMGLFAAGDKSSGFTGLLPNAKYFSAGVFRKSGKRLDTTAEWIVQALDWLVGERVSVINLSFGGPRNLLLEVALRSVASKGITVVASAGNSGPQAAPVFPAAQPEVVAVTALDADLKPYRNANRGLYIDVAAPGVDVWSLKPSAGGKYWSGTSFATPFVTAAIALSKAPNQVGLPLALQQKATDLGEPGKDTTFGLGLLQFPQHCQN